MRNEQNKIDNIKENLMCQVRSVFGDMNQDSIATRYRYLQAEDRFCTFLSETFKTQKLENVQTKHLMSYVCAMQDKGLSPSTIKTDIAGIRYFHEHMDSKNKLLDNDGLKAKLQEIDRTLDRRQVGGIDRHWTQEEIHQCKMLASELGHEKVVMAAAFGTKFGCRLVEMLRMEKTDLVKALDTGYLHVIGKNGQERDIPVYAQDQRELLIRTRDNMISNGYNGKVFVQPGEHYQQVKSEIQNFISNHRDKFTTEERVSNALARELQDKDYIPKSVLTCHGWRHTYVQNRVTDLWEKYNYIEDKEDRKERIFKEISEEVGHHRTDVVLIYCRACLGSLS